MKQNEKKILVGGLNTDDAYSILPAGDYQIAKNVRIAIGPDGKVAAIKNTPGNVIITNSALSSGTYTVIGSIEDKGKGRHYFFVHHSGGSHGIFCYRQKENDVKTILLQSSFSDTSPNVGLAFETTNLITGLAVIGDYLFWTDNNNHPYRVNVERGLRTYDATYVSPDGSTPDIYNILVDFEDDWFTVIRRPPRYPLTVAKLDSTTTTDVADQVNNFVKDDAFQFSYRYIWAENEYSVPAPFSKLINYDNPDNTETYDIIVVSMPKTELIPKEVSRIQFLVRKGNTGSFAIIKDMDRATFGTTFEDHNTTSGTAVTVYYHNNITGIAVPDEAAYKLFDSVPITAKALEVAKNRLFMANNVMDYEFPSGVSMTAEVIQQQDGTAITGEYIYAYVVFQSEGVTTDYANYAIFFLVLINTGDPGIDGFYNYGDIDNPADFANGSLPSVVTLSASDRMIEDVAASDTDIEDAILDYLYPSTPAINTANAVIDRTYTGTQPTVFGLGAAVEIEEGFSQFKSNSKYQIGIVLFDFAGRNPGVITSQDLVVVTPDREYNQADFNTAIAWTIESDDSVIPSWATHYAIVRTKNLSTSSFIQHATEEVKYVEKNAEGVYSFVNTYDESTTIYVAWSIERLENNKLGYTFNQGDILRAYFDDNTTKYTLRVKEQYGKYVLTEPVDLGNLAASGADDYLIEISTPYIESIYDGFYEVGNTYKIINPGSANPSFSQRTGTLTGDVVIKFRTLPGGGTIYCEAMNPNDSHWSEWITDVGRVNYAFQGTSKQLQPGMLVNSNSYVQGSNINGLCSFDALDFRHIDASAGAVQKLVLAARTQEYGTVLLVICSNETLSIYVGETEIYDNNGSAILSTSGNVIGNINNLAGSYGTQNPESVAEYEGQVFFLDARRGKVIRYSGNGLYPISDIKMSKFFTKVGHRIYTQDLTCVGAIDPSSREYLLALPETDMAVPYAYLSDYVETTTYNIAGANRNHPLGIFLEPGETIVVRVSMDRLGIQSTLYINDPAGATATRRRITTFGIVEVEITIEATEYSQLYADYFRDFTIEVDRFDRNPHVLDDGQAKVIAYSIDNNRWSTAYTFTPQWMGQVNGLLLSWSEGETYVHDGSESFNVFYGVTYDTEIGIIVNQMPSVMKTFTNLAIASTDYPYFTHLRCENREQSSSLLAANWKRRENMYWYAAILKDRLSPNSGNYAPYVLQFRGEDMKSLFLQVLMKFNIFATELNVFFIDAGWIPSSGHKHIT